MADERREGHGSGAVSHPSLESVTTIREDGSRPFLFPADVRGKLTRWRFIVGFLLIALFAALPWIRVGEHPAVFLDVVSRRFHLLGFTFAAQDLWLLFFLITGAGFTLFLVTALLGRIWCGWACPHTVFLDFIYRPIERLIDGDAQRRRALDAQPWTASKIVRRVIKHALYLLVAAAIANLFLAYFISLPELWHMIGTSPGEHGSVFAFIFITTGVLYFDFAWFREQLCIVLCPYGRLQSILIDDHSLVIGYDAKRGEPRGKKGAPGAGDCIACNRCVNVCPTGIDIRQGLQMECVGCAACIDACDAIMDRVGRPRGLVRYDSLAGLAGGKTRWIRPRTVVYCLLLLAGTIVAMLNFANVRPANFAITRIIGTAYIVDSQNVRNQFMVRIVNKSDEPASFILSAESALPVKQTGLTDPISLAPMQETVLPLVFSQSRAHYTKPFAFVLILREISGKFELRREARFLGPDSALLKEEDLEKGIQR